MAESVHPLVLRAREALARSELRTAELAMEERLKTAGRDINALEVRYLIQKHRGQLGEAARTLDTVIGINPRADWAHNELIQLLLTHGKAADAEQVTRNAMRVNPDNPQANHVLGRLLSDAGDLKAGERHLRRALELDGKPPGFHVSLADNLLKQGRREEAQSFFARAHELAPNDVQTLVSWSSAAEPDQAAELLERAAALAAPEDLNLPRASHLSRTGRAEAALALLDAAKNLSGTGLLMRGRLHERLGKYDQAWQDYGAGQRKLATEANGPPYKGEAVEALFGRFKQFFNRENLARLPRAALRADLPQPIFLVGAPRSGAKWVEAILARHPAVTAGGELPFLGELRKVASDLLPSQQPFPDNLAHSWTADRHYAAAVLRDHYLARAERYGLTAGGKRYFIDRTPFNEVYLPLVKMAFPLAKIVHVSRHPLDVCVSMMANDVRHGFNCGYRLEDTAHHLAAVSELLDHYHRELDLGCHSLRYEALVANPSGETRRLLDYIELPFVESCMPTVETSSVDRHQHFTQYLRPYASRLQRLLVNAGNA
ncbi:MAG TPA: sulfotransferase [Steroidobacteraceae bacterium]|nr:sulfotransferase [Steroidobacteraceae bacterium]